MCATALKRPQCFASIQQRLSGRLVAVDGKSSAKYECSFKLKRSRINTFPVLLFSPSSILSCISFIWSPRETTTFRCNRLAAVYRLVLGTVCKFVLSLFAKLVFLLVVALSCYLLPGSLFHRNYHYLSVSNDFFIHKIKKKYF